MRKIIENFSHHLDDYECMWNGIEDIYMNITGESLPDQFFFAMSGFCSFAYIKTNKTDIKRMVSFGDNVFLKCNSRIKNALITILDIIIPF